MLETKVQNQHYSIQGRLLGSCGCQAFLDCLCCEGNDVPQGCSSFLVYEIGVGQIQGQDVSSCLVVRVMRESDQTSFLYLDARASDPQRLVLIQAFSGVLGGWLEQVAQMFPKSTSPRIAPISLIWSGRFAELQIGCFSIHKGLKASSFCYQG